MSSWGRVNDHVCVVNCAFKTYFGFEASVWGSVSPVKSLQNISVCAASETVTHTHTLRHTEHTLAIVFLWSATALSLLLWHKDTEQKKFFSEADQSGAWKMTQRWPQPVRNSVYLWADVCYARANTNTIIIKSRRAIRGDQLRWQENWPKHFNYIHLI